LMPTIKCLHVDNCDLRCHDIFLRIGHCAEQLSGIFGFHGICKLKMEWTRLQ
jgi:hypothetical protein